MDLNEKKRIPWIDFVKGICMFMIIMCHAGWPYWIERFLNPFFMSALFFVSGWTFNPKSTFKQFVSGKAKTLLIPYISFGIINSLLAYLADGDPLIVRFQGLLLSRAGYNDDLWYIACLFVIEMLFYWIARKVKNINVQFIVSLCISIISYIYILNVLAFGFHGRLSRLAYILFLSAWDIGSGIIRL